ncbi:MAG: universal stress protein [Acetobacteraceae bacterium]|nr:universal stress protein [Acetobacteraceae bacterium]
MGITTIALHVEPDAVATIDSRLSLPLAIAEAHGAHVTALVFSTTAHQVGTAGSTAGDPAAEEDAVAAHLRAALEARGLRFEVRGRSSFAYGIGPNFADQMRVSDIGMIVFRSGADLGRRMVATGGLFSSGRPLLLVPTDYAVAAHPRRIILAWDASPASVRAVHGALPLATRADQVTVVSVTDDKEFRPGQSGVELAHLLARHGVRATFHPVERGRGGVSAAIMDVAREVQADMLVMGAVRHGTMHNLVFGSATMELLDHGPALPTLMAA